MVNGHSLQGGETIQGFETFFTAMPRRLDAAKGQFNAATGAVVIDKHLAASKSFGNSELTPAIASPHASHQPKRGGVGKLHGLIFAVKTHG